MSCTPDISWCERLLQGPLTPLQRSEIDGFLEAAAIASYPLDDLLRLQQRIVTHWEAINVNASVRDAVFGRMNLVRQFLADKLREDYLGIPLHASEDTLAAIRIEAIEVVEDIKDDLACDELTLDSAYALQRMTKVLEREGRPQNDVQDLIDKRDWPNLAATLIADHRLLHCVTERPGKDEFLTAIYGLQWKYFDRLSSQYGYELTDAARQLAPPPEADQADEAAVLALSNLSM